ncbi:MAG TPA: hypothetical protein VN256_15705 [Pyrinomonadaceae bacterium]|nr:hypothetical protein [Pyrinomonadaceae bacterium]
MIRRTATGVALACLLAAACSCSSRGGPDEGPRAQAAAPATTAPAPAGNLGFGLNNLTGSTLRAFYISPSDSAGWEENVLGEDKLNDGGTVDIRFSPEESAAFWDIKAESADGHYAEWKNLDLRGVSRVTLLVKMAGGPVVVAEVE